MSKKSVTAAAAAAAATPHVTAPDAPITEEGADGKEKQVRFKRDKDDTPVEELFDLTKPIPKVRWDAKEEILHVQPFTSIWCDFHIAST